jgi:hypothetical protein
MTLTLALLLGQWMYPAPWGPACFGAWDVVLPPRPGDRMHLLIEGMTAGGHETERPGFVCVLHADFNARMYGNELGLVEVEPITICCPAVWGRECCESAAHSSGGPVCAEPK